MSKGTVFVLVILSALLSGNAFAERPLEASGGAGAMGNGDMRKPLEIKGQTRAVNMLMVMQAQKDRINFIGPRRDFRKQVLSTNY